MRDQMGDDDALWKSLRSRLETQPDARFDREFWRRFNSEFSKRPSRFKDWRWITVPLAASIIAVLAWKSVGHRKNMTLTAEADFLRDLKMFEELGDTTLTASDADWDFLLKGHDNDNT